MRALDCDCGQHLEAANDKELFDKAKEHVNRDHPNMQLTDEQVRQLVAERAYDKTDDRSSQPSDILAGTDIPSRASAMMGGGGMEPSSTRPMPQQNRERVVQEEGEQEEKGLIDRLKDKLTGR
jgi:hypothetical protein